MLVTLPALMLLLDIWPMNRCVQAGQIQWRALAKCLAEKLPFVGLTLAFAVLTLWTQQTSGAVVPESLLPLAARLERVGAAYMAYVGMTLWPSSLRVFYPYIKDLDQLSIHAGWGILLVISFLAVANGRRFPWCLVGWCWFLGTLVPVIGIIQVGQCRYADRYSYFPQLGLWLAIVMPLCAWAERSKRRCVCSICLGIAGLLVLSQLCFLQVQTWHDSKSLWMHALTTEEHYYKRGKLAEHLIYIGDFEAARFQLEKGLAMVPNEARLYLLLGMCCSSEGDFENARRAFEQVILLEPERPEAHHNLGDTLMALGDLKGAEEASRRALQLNPQLVAARGNLAMLLFRKGKVHEALKHATQAATEGPREPSVQLQFGTILAESGHWHEAETVLEKSLSLKESLPMAHFYLAKAAERRGETPRAVSHFYRLTELPLENPDAFLESAVYLLQHQQESAGRAALERLTRLAPDYVPSQELLKRLLAQ
jgi:Flp pilus assembly protein TadD